MSLISRFLSSSSDFPTEWPDGLSVTEAISALPPDPAEEQQGTGYPWDGTR